MGQSLTAAVRTEEYRHTQHDRRGGKKRSRDVHSYIEHLGVLDYRFQPMTVAVQDNHDWLVKEGLLAKSG
ncbi:MAG: hypothetical protein JRF54_13970 [Deltaproteobacteria bacterium]|nr:hypothetical protein [Deltaproteobacteria bacterium]